MRWHHTRCLKNIDVAHWRKYIKHQIFLINILIVEKTKLPRSNMLIEKILYWKYTNTPSCKFFFKGKLFF
jgi:hypothetical protein